MPAHFIRVYDLGRETPYTLFDQARMLEGAFLSRSLPQALRGGHGARQIVPLSDLYV